ncbi:hypothetical protein N665_0766s0008 [Sinapis alba]|nr:hypothetical protein N665_0766s0008 [Sinapis alba]
MPYYRKYSKAYKGNAVPTRSFTAQRSYAAKPLRAPSNVTECHSSCLEAKASSGESNMLHSEVVNLSSSVVKSASGPDQKEFATSSNNNEEDVLTEVDQDMEP